MLALRTYVAGLASELDATSAASLIQAAGLLVAQTVRHTKLLLAATYAPATGVARVAVNVSLLIGQRTSKKATFTYSWSADGGKTWSAGVTTGYARLDVPDLTPGTYLFRVFATVGKIPGEPTQPTSLTIPLIACRPGVGAGGDPGAVRRRRLGAHLCAEVGRRAGRRMR